MSRFARNHVLSRISNLDQAQLFAELVTNRSVTGHYQNVLGVNIVML